MNENDNEKKIGGVSYKDKNEDIHSFLFKDSTSIENGYRLFLQDELVAYKPIDLNDFDSLFRCNINPHIHMSRTGIIYRNVNKVFYSENDSVSFRRNAFLTDVRIIDIKGEMKNKHGLKSILGRFLWLLHCTPSALQLYYQHSL